MSGVTESRVRHWVADRALLGIRVGQRRRFPAFQFGPDGRPLPGLATILTALPAGWPPAQLAAFMTTAQAELTLDEAGQPVTPAQWLAARGDPAAVTALLQPDW